MGFLSNYIADLGYHVVIWLLNPTLLLLFLSVVLYTWIIIHIKSCFSAQLNLIIH